MRPRTSVETAIRLRRRLPLLLGLSATLQVFLGAGQAHANGFSDWTCKNVPFADQVCATVQATNHAINFASDPLGYIAQFFNNAVTSLLTEMIKALLSTTRIDWGDSGFLRTYSMAFAASSVLTVIMWLIAVAKRAFQGVPPFQALTESIGYLLMSVLVSAFAPAAVAYVVQMFDSAAETMFAPVAGDAGKMALTLTAAMGVLMVIPGGDVIVMFLALGLLSAVAGVWLELIVRNALILAGLVFGVSVFSGLVDRNLWGHVKRWVGVMGGIIASKYVTLTTLALATGTLTGRSTSHPSVAQAFGTVFTGIALLWLALYLPWQISKFLPILGDELQGMYQARDDFKGRAGQAGSTLGDSFDELKNRFGGGGAGGDSDGAEGGCGEEPGAEGEAAASATGVGAAAGGARKGVDMAKAKTSEVAERGVDGATGGGSGGGAEGVPDSGGGSFGAPDPSAATDPGGTTSWPPPELPDQPASEGDGDDGNSGS